MEDFEIHPAGTGAELAKLRGEAHARYESYDESSSGTWTLIAPDGRQWQGQTPLAALSAEQSERIPADVALGRVLSAADEPDFAERHVQLGTFYGAKNTDDLIDKMEAHIARLQEKLSEREPNLYVAPKRAREG